MKALTGRLRYVVIAAAVMFVALIGSLAIVEILQVERGQVADISEHREFNQYDHDVICQYHQDEARAEGRPVYPCGSEAHP